MTSVIPFETSAAAQLDGSGSDQQARRRRSRPRGWRAGLASETVIENLEDPRCYRALERSIVGSFGPRTVIELELVHRLASLLWRLRRASAIETGLLGMQGGNLFRKKEVPTVGPGRQWLSQLQEKPTAAIKTCHLARPA
jgi:hypothetical protein